MTLDAARQMVEEKRKLGMDVAKAVELAARLHCTPDETAQLLREYSGNEPTPSPANPQATPILQIDWGMDLKPGTHLTPEFTILGTDAHTRPLVHFPLDHRIQCEDWNPMPKLSRNDRGWRFYQPLRLNEPGQYLLEVTLIDPTPGRTEPGCYRCNFRVTVPDRDAGQKARSLEINAEGLTANLPELLGDYDHVKINVGGDGVINAPGKSSVVEKIGQMLHPDKSGTKHNESQHITLLPFFPVSELAAKIPYVNDWKPEQSHARATLHIANALPIHLICGKTLTFGRNVPEMPCLNDVPLVIVPETGDDASEEESAAFVRRNKSFSREHALISVTDQIVTLDDCRSPDGLSVDAGTILDDKPLAKKESVVLFTHNDAPQFKRTIVFAQILAMQVTPYSETVEMDVCRELPEELLLQLYRGNLLQQQHFSAVKVMRSETIPEPFQSWLIRTKFSAPQFIGERHLLVVSSATLGGGRNQVISMPGRDWHDVRLRFLNLDGRLYLENTVDTPQLVVVFNNTETVLKPLRPIPIQPGLVVRKATVELFRFE